MVVAPGVDWSGRAGIGTVRVPSSVEIVTDVGTECRPSFTMVMGSEPMVVGAVRLYCSQLSRACAVPNPGCQ